MYVNAMYYPSDLDRLMDCTMHLTMQMGFKNVGVRYCECNNVQ